MTTPDHGHDHPHVPGPQGAPGEPPPEALHARIQELEAVVQIQQEKYKGLDEDHTQRIIALRQLDGQLKTLSHVVGQLSAENRVLRKRLGIGELDPIEIDTEKDAAEVGNAQVADVPDQPTGDSGPAVQEQPPTSPPEGETPA